MRRRRPALPILVALACSAPAPAERFSNPPVEAKVIVTGHVRSIQSKVVPHAAGGTDNSYSIRLVVAGVERGDGVTPGQTIDLTCWQAATRPGVFGRIGLNGQHYIPREGELVRTFLDNPTHGVHDVWYGAGIVALAPSAAVTVASAPPVASGDGLFEVSLVGSMCFIGGLLLGRRWGQQGRTPTA
jgi:hypothetical protein